MRVDMVCQCWHLAIQAPYLPRIFGIVDLAVEDELAHFPVDLTRYEGVGAGLMCDTDPLHSKLVCNVLKPGLLAKICKDLNGGWC